MARVYWRRIHSFPAGRPGDIRVILEKDWNAPPLERPDGHETGWDFIDVTEEENQYIEAEVNESLGLCGDHHDRWLIIDSMAVWGAIALAGVFSPELPSDMIYGCPWQPDDIIDGGTNENPSPTYEELQAACAMIWDDVAPGTLVKD